jgi:hypothetical protein
MLELLVLLIGVIPTTLRGRRDPVLENLLLRHQLAVALRPKPRLRLKARDKLLWTGRRWARSAPALCSVGFTTRTSAQPDHG